MVEIHLKYNLIDIILNADNDKQQHDTLISNDIDFWRALGSN
jgi:hypothetical protein